MAASVPLARMYPIDRDRLLQQANDQYFTASQLFVAMRKNGLDPTSLRRVIRGHQAHLPEDALCVLAGVLRIEPMVLVPHPTPNPERRAPHGSYASLVGKSAAQAKDKTPAPTEVS